MKVVCILLAVVAVALAGTPWVGESRGDNGWPEKHNRFVNQTRDNNGSIKVLFYGDSITEGWGGAGKSVFDQYYAPLGTANYGIGGDRTEHTLWRMKNGEVTDNLSSVKLCVIKIGTNNMGANIDNDIAMGAVFNVIELRERLPQMKVLVLGVLPRSNAEITARTGNINAVLQRLDNGQTIRYLDMKDHFYLGDGRFETDLYTADLVHLTTAGYQKWAQVMAPLFNEMLGNLTTT